MPVSEIVTRVVLLRLNQCSLAHPDQHVHVREVNLTALPKRLVIMVSTLSLSKEI